MAPDSYYLQLNCFSKFTMIICGVYPLELKKSNILQMIYDSVSTILLGLYYCVILFHVFICVPVVMKNEKIYVIAISISHALSISITAVKATVYVSNRMKKLINQCFSKNQKFYGLKFNEHQKEEFKRNAQIFDTITKVLFCFICAAVISLWVTSTYFYYKTVNIDKYPENSYVMEDLFPFLDHPKIGLFYKISGITIMAIYRSLVGLYSIMPPVYLAGQLKTIQNITRNLDKSKDAVIEIKKIIRWHQDIIKFIQELNNLLSFTLLLDYIVTTVTLAALMLVDLLPDSNTMVLAFSFEIFVVYTGQLFLMAWQATNIVDLSSAFSDSLAFCYWYEQSEELKKIILIMLMRTQRPLSFRVGKFFPMTFKTALSSLKLAYSYATMALAMELS